LTFSRSGARTGQRAIASDPRTGRVLLAGWLLIAGKCWLVTWLIGKYHVPLDPLWVVVPTVMFALLCTVVYYRRE